MSEKFSYTEVLAMTAEEILEANAALSLYNKEIKKEMNKK